MPLSRPAGTEYLLRAFSTLARRYDGVQLLTIGDGPLRRSLQALATSLGVQDRVRLLGALGHEEVLSWMRKAAMLVLPGIRTATGTTPSSRTRAEAGAVRSW
jgi:glycosyltransferase involved in cell wall biosynthesis